MAKKKNKAATAKAPEGAEDADGTSPATFIDKSVAASGLSREEWLRRFNAAAKASGHPANVTDGDSFKGWLDGMYARPQGYGTEHSGGLYNTMVSIDSQGRQGLGKGTHFLYDSGWQYKSSVDFKTFKPVDGEPTPEERKKHLKDGSWIVVGKGKDAHLVAVEHHYADPSQTNFIARKGGSGKLGDIYKVWDPAHPENVTYAMLMDRSPSKINGVDGDAARTEVSHPVFDDVGMKATPYGVDGHLMTERLGPNTLPKMENPPKGMEGVPAKQPTSEEVKEQGRRLDPKAVKPEPKTGDAGAFQIKKGEETVLVGGKCLPAAYADPSCVHTGGGHIIEGSSTVFVGKQKLPFARVNDPTNDGYHVNTGEDTVEVGD
jgi:uncharacterized Zn-binding protein involved in type VI secretion